MRYLVPTPLVENIPGKYYVLDKCNGCGLCKSVADELFDYTDGGKYYFICRQPYNETEEELLREAIDICVMDAICDDGDQTFFDIWN